MDRHFLIGEVADLLGVSRDTLRIYEEEGLISPKRDENGYMLFCYLNTEFDIRAGKRPVRSYLELSGQEIEALGLSDRIMDKNALSAMDCIKFTVCSPVPYPEEEHIDSVINYAVSEGIRLKGTVYAHSMYHLIENGEHLHMVEIYAPVD